MKLYNNNNCTARVSLTKNNETREKGRPAMPVFPCVQNPRGYTIVKIIYTSNRLLLITVNDRQDWNDLHNIIYNRRIILLFLHYR